MRIAINQDFIVSLSKYKWGGTVMNYMNPQRYKSGDYVYGNTIM